MSVRHDAIVIGAGPAGSTAALVLARAGLDVVVLDKQHHPRFRLGESFMPKALQVLRELGLEKELRALPHVHKAGAEFVMGHEREGFMAQFESAYPVGGLDAFNVERAPFDAMMCRVAREAGATVYEDTAVREVLRLDDDDVVVRTDQGELSARWLLDCSGPATVLGHHLKQRRALPGMKRVAAYAHAQGVYRRPAPQHGFVVGIICDDGWFWLIPINDETTSVGVVLNAEVVRQAGVPADELLQWAIARCPQMVERCAQATLPPKNECVSNFSYTCEPYVGPGHFLVGDAAAFVDPIFSTGVTLGMVGGRAAAELVVEIVRDGLQPDEARRRYLELVTPATDIFFELVRNYYDHSFRELFLSGRNPLSVRRAILTLLAGHAFPAAQFLRWRLAMMRGFVWLQKRLPLVPRRGRYSLLTAAPVEGSVVRGMASRPPGHWLLGHLPEQRRDPLGLLMRGLQEHGDMVRYRFGPYRVLQLNHPRLFRRVLLDNAGNYRKWQALQRAAPVLGQGLVLAEGASWKRNRRLYGRAFRSGTMRAMVAPMVDSTRGLLRHWEGLGDGAHSDVLDDAMRVTLSIVSRTLISRDLGGFGEVTDQEAAALGQAFDAAVREVGARTLDLNPLAGKLPTAHNRAFNQVIRTLDAAMADIIAKRRRRADPPSDLLGWLMEARDEETGEGLDDIQLRDELLNILLAGRGTSAIGLSWMWWLLDQHPSVADAIRAEAFDVLGDDDPTPETVGRLDLAGRAFQEAMRLYPPIWTIARQAVERDTIGGEPVDPGTLILISPYAVHRHPELWPDPERFDPDRFLPERAAGRERLAWMPFGAGPRTCIGGTFAMQEAKIITSMVARRFRLVRDRTEAPKLEPLITLKPHGGMPMRIEALTP